MCTSLYSCVMGLIINENVADLRESDEEMMSSMQNMKSTLEAPNEFVQLSDSIAYYKSEKKYVDLGHD